MLFNIVGSIRGKISVGDPKENGGLANVEATGYAITNTADLVIKSGRKLNYALIPRYEYERECL